MRFGLLNLLLTHDACLCARRRFASFRLFTQNSPLTQNTCCSCVGFRRACGCSTLYDDAFFVLGAGSAVFLHLSYTMPIAAGLLAEGKTWKHKGPFSLGGFSKILAVLAVIGGAFVQFVGMKPPNEKVFYLMVAMLLVMAIFWFVLGESKRFKGPPAVKE